jgi:5-methylcytosine-specific restriction endonuclease McrA
MIVREITYNLKNIYSLIPDEWTEEKKFVYYSGFEINIHSKRLWTIKNNPKCCCCGLKVLFAKLECHNGGLKPHINFYGEETFKRNKEEVLFTRDHINPISLSEDDSLENSRTLCYICNFLKDNSFINDEELLKKRIKYKEFRDNGLKHKDIFNVLKAS